MTTRLGKEDTGKSGRNLTSKGSTLLAPYLENRLELRDK